MSNTHRHNQPLGVGNGVCKMRVQVKNGLLHKLGLVQPPYF